MSHISCCQLACVVWIYTLLLELRNILHLITAQKIMTDKPSPLASFYPSP